MNDKVRALEARKKRLQADLEQTELALTRAKTGYIEQRQFRFTATHTLYVSFVVKAATQDEARQMAGECAAAISKAKWLESFGTNAFDIEFDQEEPGAYCTLLDREASATNGACMLAPGHAGPCRGVRP